MKPISFIAAASLALSGCVNLGLDAGGKEASEIVYYVMDDAGRTPVAAASLNPRVLVLTDTQAGAFYDTDGMAYSRQPGTRAYYQFARWSERAGKRFTDLLLTRLEAEKIFSTVAQTGTNVQGDWLLITEIVEHYHDASQQPGAVRMLLRAEVVDIKARKLIARNTFSQSVPAASYNAAGAHQAFNQAATQTLNEMADWLKTLR